MSGSLLCGLASVGSQPGGQLPSVPRVTQPLPFTDLYSRQCSTCTSLPPLPKYTEPVLSSKRWGEDNHVVEKTCHMWDNGRNNFDSCHSVPDVLSKKYEGYMFPKPLCEDIGVLIYTPSNTSRRTPRDPVRELFPTHNPLRKAKVDNGKRHVLGQTTRQALSDYITRLYRTSRYDLNYKDTRDFMRRKSDRDDQYREVMKDFCEAATCCNVLNHPYPCPYCWTGGANKAAAQNSTLTTPRKGGTYCTQETDHGDTGKSCDQCDVISCNGGEDCTDADNDLTNDNGSTKNAGKKCGEECDNESECIEASECVSVKTGSKDNVKMQHSDAESKNNGKSSSQQAANKSDTFGPWSGDTDPSENCEPLLLSNVYNFKLPSSLHKPHTENEYSSTYLERHGTQSGNEDKHRNNLGAWTLRREKMSDTNNATTKPVEKKEEDSVLNKWLEKQRELKEQVLKSQRNCWTFRDKENNLRIPCISKVIGYKNKTDVHTKIHVDHPEPTPDLRDFKRYSKRVNFYGYNASVFR